MLYSNNEDPSKLYKRTHQGERANKLKQRVSHFWQLMVSYTPMRGVIKRGQKYPVAFRLVSVLGHVLLRHNDVLKVQPLPDEDVVERVLKKLECLIVSN